MKVRYHIPFNQPLSPRRIVGFGDGQADRFWSSFRQLQYYYLARNAIWHGVGVLGLIPGDGVLVPAYHHGVELQVLLRRGLRAFYYGIDGRCETDLKHLTGVQGDGIRALYVTHYWGFPQPIEELCNFASKRGLSVIEDCALSLFSRSGGRPLGAFGAIGVFCLYKTLPLPHGGVLALNHNDLKIPPAPPSPGWPSTGVFLGNRLVDYLDLRGGPVGHGLAAAARRLGRIGKSVTGTRPVLIDTEELEETHVDLGMASISRRLLRGFDAGGITERRRRNFEQLVGELQGKVRLVRSALPPGTCPLSLPIRVIDKVAVQIALRREGIQTINFWSHHHPTLPPGRFPEVDRLRAEVLEVPIHQELEPKHIAYIGAALRRHARWQ